MSTRTITSRPHVVLLLLLSLSIFINYVDRGNLSTAAPLIKDELHISATQLGFLLTSFFISYSIGNFVAGWLVDRIQAFHVLLVGFVVWSLATTLSGFAAGFAVLFALRLVLGAGESVAFPAYAHIISRCFTETQRGIANATITAAMALGPAFGIFFGGLLIAAYSWRAFFIGFGLVSLIWVIPWMAFGRKCLATVSTIAARSNVSFRAVIRTPALWGASVGHFCGAYVWYFLLTWVPFYLVRARHWSISEMAAIGGVAYLVTALSMMISGRIADRWIHWGASPTLARKTFLITGLTATAVFMVGCVMSGTVGSIVFLTLACLGYGMTTPNLFAAAQTLAGTHASGRWVGIQNALGNLSGIIAPALTGILVDRTGNFLAPFLVAAAVSLFGAFAWIVLVGPIEETNWLRVPEASRVEIPASS